MLFHKDNSVLDANSTDGTAIAGPPEAEVGAVLTVDCAAIVRNWKKLSNHAAPAECAAVVKADAYGCGLEPVTAALAAAGCKTFFVAQIAEARQLRDTVSDAAIYVTNGIPSGAAPLFAEINAQPVIGNLAELAEWDAFHRNSNWEGGAALHFDTGMNRLGLDVDEAAAIAERTRMSNHGITLVMSHFACSDEPAHPLNTSQTQTLRDMRQLFRNIPFSLANSSGIFSRRAGAFRHRAPRHRALRRQSDAGWRQSGGAGRHADRAHCPDPRDRERRNRRLQRDLDRETPDPRRYRRNRLRRRLSAPGRHLRHAHGRTSDGRRKSAAR